MGSFLKLTRYLAGAPTVVDKPNVYIAVSAITAVVPAAIGVPTTVMTHGASFQVEETGDKVMEMLTSKSRYGTARLEADVDLG